MLVRPEGAEVYGNRDFSTRFLKNVRCMKNFSFTLQPVFPGYTSLPEDPDKKIHTDL